MKEGWEYKKLGEVATIINGKNQKAVEDESGIYPICGSGGIMGYANDFLCPEQTVIIGRKGNINRPIYMEQKFWNVDTAFGIVANKSHLVPKFLYYFCIDFNFEKLNKAVTIPSLVKSDLLKIDMPAPSLSEQQHIVEELDLLSSIIENKNAQLIELDNLAQSLFYEMFGDPITNEKGWEKQKWNSVLKIINGKKQKAVENASGSYPIYGSGGIMGYAIDFLCPKNTVIIGRKGNINKPILVHEPFWNVDTAFGLVSNEGIIDHYYLFYFCVFFDFENLNKAVTIPSLTKRDLLEIEIPIPPFSLQSKFASKIEAIEHQKELIRQSIREVKTLFNSRVDYYFN